MRVGRGGCYDARDNHRRTRGELRGITQRKRYADCRFYVLISHPEGTAEGTQDLLVRNPNHVIPDDDGTNSLSEGDEE